MGCTCGVALKSKRLSIIIALRELFQRICDQLWLRACHSVFLITFIDSIPGLWVLVLFPRVRSACHENGLNTCKRAPQDADEKITAEVDKAASWEEKFENAKEEIANLKKKIKTMV